MPLYEYECESCGTRLERIQKFSDALLEMCPKCGGKLRKLISSPAFQFKGSGFYATDYARKGDGKEAKDAKDAKDTKDTKDAKDTKDSSTGASDPATKDASKESPKESSKESTKTDKPAASDK